uniref:BTB domain-containing protein n=1 Tax=Leersia perrieri TaxID=77586 RepID=A0A0D9X412_9ORYZ
MLAARSRVFRAELYGAMKENGAGHVITITDIQPSVFKAFLHFIYTDDMPPELLAVAGEEDENNNTTKVDMARHLLVAADRYGVERLRVICERVLCRSLDVATVMDTMALADRHSCSDLMEACVEFIASQKKESVMETDGCKNLKRTCPSVVVDMWERITTTATATESMSKIETVWGTHRFTFHGYSLSKGVGAGRCFRSGTFTVGGFDWCICFYPEGQHDGAGAGGAAVGDHVSVSLRLLSRGATARAFYVLRLIDQDTGRPAAVARRTDGEPRVFASETETAACCFGRRAFMERSKLESSPSCLRDDCVVIDCAVRVVLDVPVVAAVRRGETPEDDLLLPPSNILRQIVSQIEADGADVTFTVGEKGNNPETFTAHRMMLAARSPVFRAELYGSMRENDTGHVITIRDIQPAVFKALLHFIYTDDMPPELLAVAGEEEDNDDDDTNRSVDMARHLLVAADRYAVERLRVICERVLCRSIDVETVMETMALADQHSCGELKEACVQFVGRHSKERIVETEGYKYLKRTCPSLIVDMWERIVRGREI